MPTPPTVLSSTIATANSWTKGTLVFEGPTQPVYYRFPTVHGMGSYRIFTARKYAYLVETVSEDGYLIDRAYQITLTDYYDNEDLLESEDWEIDPFYDTIGPINR